MAGLGGLGWGWAGLGQFRRRTAKVEMDWPQTES